MEGILPNSAGAVWKWGSWACGCEEEGLGCFTGYVWVGGLSSREELGVENCPFTNPSFG